jgi:hypothetical protein
MFSTIILFNFNHFFVIYKLFMSGAWKQPRLKDFFTQEQNKGRPSSRSRSWNNKNKNENTTHAKQKSNKILLQKKQKKIIIKNRTQN